MKEERKNEENKQTNKDGKEHGGIEAIVKE